VVTDEHILQKLLLDDDFLEIVLSRSESSVEWETYFENNDPKLKDVSTEARDILLFVNEDKKCLTPGELEELRSRIVKSLGRDNPI